ncbi:MAG: hypothetical protein WCJ81_04695 [bacterium]
MKKIFTKAVPVVLCVFVVLLWGGMLYVIFSFPMWWVLPLCIGIEVMFAALIDRAWTKYKAFSPKARSYSWEFNTSTPMFWLFISVIGSIVAAIRQDEHWPLWCNLIVTAVAIGLAFYLVGWYKTFERYFRLPGTRKYTIPMPW